MFSFSELILTKQYKPRTNVLLEKSVCIDVQVFKPVQLKKENVKSEITWRNGLKKYQESDYKPVHA